VLSAEKNVRSFISILVKRNKTSILILFLLELLVNYYGIKIFSRLKGGYFGRYSKLVLGHYLN